MADSGPYRQPCRTANERVFGIVGRGKRLTISLEIRDFDRNEWSCLISKFDDISLLQCWEYAEAKSITGPWLVERGQFVDSDMVAGGDRVVGVFQAMIRPLPLHLPGGLAWINRGPLWRSSKGGTDNVETLSAMVQGLRRHYAEDRHMYLRIAPPVETVSPAAKVLGNAAMTNTATAGWASSRLDLTLPLDNLRSALKAKWRSSLKKSENAGIKIISGRTNDIFAIFLDQHRRMIAEKGFVTSLTPEMISCLRDQQSEESKMTVFLAYLEGTLLGSVLIAGYCDTAEYLAGNTTDEGRRNNAGQLLLWRAITAMRDEGSAIFDLGGMDDKLTPRGIYKFKQGLNGSPYRLVTEMEAVGGGLVGRLVRRRVNRARVAG